MKRTLTILAGAALGLPVVTHAGDLDPTAAPAPTMVTLEEIAAGVASAETAALAAESAASTAATNALNAESAALAAESAASTAAASAASAESAANAAASNASAAESAATTAAANALAAQASAEAARLAAVAAQEGRIGILPGGASTFTISQPGSYVLLGNVTMTSGVNCISITGSDVTLDLNGHTLTGLGSGWGVIISSSASGVRVHGGTIRDFFVGVSPQGGSSHIVERCGIFNCTNGVDSFGSEVFVRHCLVTDCSIGIALNTSGGGTGGAAIGNSVHNCANGILAVAAGGLFGSNFVKGNTTGISLNTNATSTTVSGNTITNNTTGVSGSPTGLVVANNIFTGNTSDGVTTVSLGSARDWGDNLAP